MRRWPKRIRVVWLDQIARSVAKQEKYIRYYNTIERRNRPKEINSVTGRSFPTSSKIFWTWFRGAFHCSPTGTLCSSSPASGEFSVVEPAVAADGGCRQRPAGRTSP